MKKLTLRILHMVLAAAVLLGCTFSAPVPALAAGLDQMEVHFMDVGQGDATLVTCGGHAMLIDAGDDSKGTAIQNYLQKQKITKLDYLVLTHPDADHIGGAPVIITKFDIGKVFVSNFEKDNKTYQKLIQSLDDKRMKPLTPAVNSKYTLGTADITILAPGKTYDNPNDASIALLLKNGTRSFLFTGDAGEDAETDILETGIDISADVYKVGHHGSKYSTSKDFFEAVDPFYAVISCGEGNSYGHPHAETLHKRRYGLSDGRSRHNHCVHGRQVDLLQRARLRELEGRRTDRRQYHSFHEIRRRNESRLITDKENGSGRGVTKGNNCQCRTEHIACVI